MGTAVAKQENNQSVESARERKRRVYSPAVDIIDRGEYLELRADMPGVREEEVDVTVEGSLLTLEGRTSVDAQKGQALYREFGFGDFSRKFELGAEINAEAIEASMKNGELTLKLPKAQPRHKRIEVRAG